jgi:hypothetical protein
VAKHVVPDVVAAIARLARTVAPVITTRTRVHHSIWPGRIVKSDCLPARWGLNSMARAAHSSIGPALPRVITTEDLITDHNFSKDRTYTAAHVHLGVFTIDRDNYTSRIGEREAILVDCLPVGTRPLDLSIDVNCVAIIYTDLYATFTITQAVVERPT